MDLDQNGNRKSDYYGNGDNEDHQDVEDRSADEIANNTFQRNNGNNNYNISMIEEEEDGLLSNDGNYSPHTGLDEHNSATNASKYLMKRS